jgi:hypothetical protein
MKSPGEDIRAARNIYACIYGEESVWTEVNVNLWMREATIVMNQLRLKTLQETLEQVRQIPINITIA